LQLKNKIEKVKNRLFLINQVREKSSDKINMDEYSGIVSKEYVLQVLDKWYSERVKKSYTKNDADRLEIEAVNILDSLEGFSVEERIELEPELLGRCSVDAMVEEAGSYFSRAYATVEGLKEGLELSGQRISDLPEGVRKEYLDDPLKSYEPMQRFVTSVRKRSQDKFPEDLTFEDIDKSFIETFGNCNNFISFSNSLLNSGLVLVDFAVSQGRLPRKAYDYTEKFIKILRPFNMEFLRKTFGDLESRVDKN
jgi:hypothetical protein